MVEVAVPRPAALHGVATLAALAARRRRGPDAVAAYQVDRVRAVVRHAATHVPAYRGVLEPGDADRLRTLDDLALLPTIDKQHLLTFEPDHRAWAPPGVTARITATSGTTGMRLPVPWAPWTSWRNTLQRVLLMRDMRIGYLGRRVALIPPDRASRAASSRGRGTVVAGRRHSLSESAPPDELAAELRRLRPDWITAEPHVLARVAEHLDGDVRPRTLTTYGVALDPLMRAELTSAYGTVPLDIYGASETGQMAWQCRAADLYHVAHEIVVIEVVDDAGHPVPKGEPGQVLLTGLINPLLPMVRYRIGDGAVWADRPCTCGHRLPALAAVIGRTFDWIVHSEGRRVPPQVLWFLQVAPTHWNSLTKYRVTQDADGAVLLELVVNASYAPGATDDIQRRYQEVLGPGTPVEVRVVDEIVTPPGQRFRQFTSQRQPGMR